MKVIKKQFLCTEKEIQHLLYMRELEFGKIEVVVHAREPQYSIEKERKIMYDKQIRSEKRLAIEIE